MLSDEFFRRDQAPGLADVKCKLFIVDVLEFEPYPSSSADIRRPVELLRRSFDQHLLNSGRSWYDDCDVPVFVMIVGEHREYLLANEEGWFTVRESLRCFGERQTDSPDALYLSCVHSPSNPDCFYRQEVCSFESGLVWRLIPKTNRPATKR